METWWMNASSDSRLHVLAACGWRTNKGPATRQARCWARLDFSELSEIVQGILIRRFLTGTLI